MTWYSMRERGSRWGVRASLFIMKTLGYSIARVLLYPISFYFYLFAPRVRRRIGDFLALATGGASAWSTWRIIFNFSESIMDRAMVMMGRADLFSLTIHGGEVAEPLKQAGRGAIVVGAHLGAWEVTRGFAGRERIDLKMLMYEVRSSMLYEEFLRLDPNLYKAIIRLEPGSTGHVLEVRERVARGDFIGILGDRVWMSGPVTRIEFLGREAEFPVGPYHLASILDCPVLLMFMLKKGRRDYHLYVEELTSPVRVPRGERDSFAEEMALKFAGRLESYAREFPLQWYNFHDFWTDGKEEAG